MSFRIRAAARVALIAAVACAIAAPALAQSKEEKKALEARQQSDRLLVRVVDASQAGTLPAGGYAIKANGKDEPVPSVADALDITWRHDQFKAVQGKIFVPFTISYEGGKSLPGNVVIYARVAKRGTPVAKEKPEYDFEQIFTGDAVPPAAGKPVEITRRIVVSPGDLDVYLAIQPAPGPEKRKDSEMVKGVVKKLELSFPDLWAPELTTSSVLVIDKIEPLKEQPTQETIVFKPYTFTGADMSLAKDSEFKKSEELTIYFHVYNPTFENKRPDVTVNYEFLKKDADGEKPAATDDGKKLVYQAQKFDAQTLPATWDPEMGFQIAPGFAIPLSQFSVGEYRLNIKITDNKSQKSIARDMKFTIVP
jgi:hypothetical protein